jgi:hypothetical protein
MQLLVDDIRSASFATDFVVVGWFTPDYRPLAERLASDLGHHDTPYHFYSVPALDGSLRQITRLKPKVALVAHDEYPGKAILMLDADCLVNGDVRPLMTSLRADIGHWMKARPKGWWSRQRGRLRFHVADRVIAFGGTPQSRRFCEMWAEDCARTDVPPRGGSEWARSHTVARAHDVTFQSLPLIYAGLEIDKAPANAIIVHRSESACR